MLTPYYRSGMLPYLLYKPAALTGALPLIMFLHGRGERGHNLDILTPYPPITMLATRQDFPAMVMLPQCPEDVRWTDVDRDVMAALAQVVDDEQIDGQRIYLTGFSMGAQGCWHIARRYVDYFAALVIVSGRLPTDAQFMEQVCSLKDKPIWLWHGEADSIVPVSATQAGAQALRDCGGQPKVTIVPTLDHVETWFKVFTDEEVYTWLLSQRL